ncbi:hypothetical protein QQZ08_006762 [Neonectria magnoliae]|uniref:Uncharacterized protein n=1 Tax=Neonectria magnoliae TaxID=2732573 RepID=A0ABR1I074_9HYPO
MTEKSDKGKRTAGGAKEKQLEGALSSRSASGQGLATRLQKLYSDFDELRKDGAGIQAYDDVCSQLAQAKKELQEQREEMSKLQSHVAELKRDKESVVRTFQDRFKTWDAEETRHTKDFEELQMLRTTTKKDQKAAKDAAQKSSQLQKELDDHKNRVNELLHDKSTLQDSLDMKSIHLRKKRDELQKCRDTLEELRADLGLLPLDPKATRDHFGRLAGKLHDLVWSHFNRTIPNSGALLDVTSTALSRIPQVPSETKVAQCIRCALVEAVIAQELSVSIFQDVYLVDDATQARLSGLFQALEWLDQTHPLPATIIRCQIAKISDGSRKVKEVPGQAAEAVRSVLGPWLRDDLAQEDLFIEALQDIFSEALQLWQSLQRTRQRAQAVVDLDPMIWDPKDDARRDYDGETREEDNMSQQQTAIDAFVTGPIAVLFPKIYMGDDGQEYASESGEDNELLFHGFALFSTQGAAVAASKEGAVPRKLRRSSTNFKRRSSEHGRRGGMGVKLQTRGLFAESQGGGDEASYSQRAALHSGRARDRMTASSLSTRSQRSGSGV